MPLPSLSGLTALDLLRLADNDDLRIRIVLMTRLSERRPIDDDWSAEEMIWLTAIAATGGLLKRTLEEVDRNEIINLWATKQPKGRGRKTEDVYLIASLLKEHSKKTRLQIYHELMKPELIRRGELPLDARGEVSPDQDLAAQKSFLSAMDRLRKKTSP